VRHRFRRSILAVAVGVLALGLVSAPGAQGGETLPGSCKLHHRHIVNPGCVPALTGEATEDVSDPPTTFPNIVPNVDFVTIYRQLFWDDATQTYFYGPPDLRFDTHVQNFGSVPLQLTVNEVDSPETSTVSQCVSWLDRVCRKQVEVGGYTWHGEHEHFHFEEFAKYELRRVGADGRADYSASGVIATNDKVSFCMLDSTRVRDDGSLVPFYNTCTPTVQGISPGWADIYPAGLDGQQFPFTGLSDGRYAIVVHANYVDRLHETNYGDNIAEVIVEVSGDVTQATIVAVHHPTATP
jgi:hypothetical protein